VAQLKRSPAQSSRASVRRKEDAVSYDLMVFDAAAVPRDRTKFVAWYEKQAEWQEPHGYNNPEIPSPALEKWFSGGGM
jgi:hypothetical protein